MSKDWKTQQDEFSDWAEMWEKAQKEVFKDAPKPPAPSRLDYFGQSLEVEDIPLRECDAKYWNKVYKLSNHQGDTPDLLSEETSEEIVKPSEWEGEPIKDKAKTLADNPNPVQHPTFKRDGFSEKTKTTRVSAGWAAEHRIKELHDMKVKLYELENKMSDAEGLNETKAKSIQTKIDALKKQIDTLSDEFKGNWANSHFYENKK